jgi:hypothetical protein
VVTGGTISSPLTIPPMVNDTDGVTYAVTEIGNEACKNSKPTYKSKKHKR